MPVAKASGMRASAAALALAAALAPAAAHAVPPVPDVNLGTVATLTGPATYRPGEPLTLSGDLRFQAALPIVFETAPGLPDQSVTILLDGEPLKTVTTDTQGTWRTDVMFGNAPPYTHELQAVAYDGTPLRAASRTLFVRRELIFTELRIDPVTASIPPNAGIGLDAVALDGEGREHHVAEQATWSSSDPQIASVSNADGSRGLVTGVVPGVVTIIARFETLTATAQITVS